MTVDVLRVLAEALRPYLQTDQSAVRTIFSQRDGERPVGCGRPKYLRAHKRAVEAGDAGAWSEGRARLMTDECWARWARTIATAHLSSAPESQDGLLAEFGAVRVAPRRRSSAMEQ